MSLRTFDKDDPVSSVMTKGVLYIASNKSLKEAADIMADFDIGSLVVVEDEKPVGIVTTKDIIKAISQDKDIAKVIVKDIMQSPVITISAYEPISSALIKMKEQKINHLLVIDGERIIGMINPLNLLAY